MPIEGIEYNTNQWDGLGKGKKVAVAPARRAAKVAPKTAPVAVRNGATVVVSAPKPAAAAIAKTPDPLMATINGIIARFRELFAWK